MLTFFLALAALATIMAAMAIGILAGRKPLSGSCGGINTALGPTDSPHRCEICGTTKPPCPPTKNQSIDTN
ncbi:MAG: (Na+)-NQR maturation NqrM [Cellvibrionales bacterium]|nr:(Na+)-NQR maturation NqrM [Cellvibrionales bacterium]